MKFKKITALLMAAAMTLSLAGCGGSGTSTTDTSAEESTDVVSGGVIQRMRQQTMRLKKKHLR